MASPSPVPSRAAINALRGVILTTSCSVILLAEERRRRIKIARSAIDNARKLHTVRVNRGPALSEALGRREAWPAELGEDLPPVAISPQSNGPLRRKRRNEQGRAVAKAIDQKPLSKSPNPTVDERRTRQKEWDEWDEARREISRISVSPFAYHELFLRVATDDEIPIPPLTAQELDPKKQDPEPRGDLPIQAKPSDAEARGRADSNEAKASGTPDTINHAAPKEEESQRALRSAFGFDEAVPTSQVPATEAVLLSEPLVVKVNAAMKYAEAVPNSQVPVDDASLPSEPLLAEVDSAVKLEDTEPRLQEPVDEAILTSEPLITENDSDTTSLDRDSISSLQSIVDEAAATGEFARQEAAAAEAKEMVAATPEMDKAKLQESFLALDNILSKLISSTANQDGLAEQLDSAIEVLQELISAKFLIPNLALLRGYVLLRAAVELQQYDKIPAIFETALPASTHVLQLIAPFMQFLEQKHDVAAVRQLLAYSSYVETQNSMHSKLDGSWVVHLLKYRWRTFKDFAAIKNLYQLLQQGGLFTDAGFSMKSQYAIRRRIVVTALLGGDDVTVTAELEYLLRLDPQAFKKDGKLLGKLIIHNARLGRWDSMRKTLSAIKGIRRQDEEYYQDILAKITLFYAKNHTPEEVDSFARELVAVFNMKLNQPLALLVMDRHGRNRDITALAHWLRFCQNEGLKMDQAFFDNVAYKCCKYWNMVQPDIQSLFKGLKIFVPWLQEPRLEKYNQTGGLDTLDKRRTREVTTQKVAKLPASAGATSIARQAFERDAFTSMNSQALQENWDQVSETYNEVSAKGLRFSSRCLRLAVIAKLNKEGCCSTSASNLVREAHADGHDVSAALVPLLIAQLEAGSDPETLINDTLRQGLRIHDSVYNKAARVLAMDGRHKQSIKICKIAAQENGHGNPAYNEYNFANLLTGCSRLGWYSDLRTLVSNYTSSKQYWHGSNECRSSIKFAMKRVALKAETEPMERHIHEEALICIDDALQHLKRCRSSIKADRQALKEKIVDAFESFQPSEVLGNGNAGASPRLPTPGPRAGTQTEKAESRGQALRRSNSATNTKTWPNRDTFGVKQTNTEWVEQGTLNVAATG
ncbi:Fc.00g091320.m01.CDS01 [Cosmosporella sp. VM-42]